MSQNYYVAEVGRNNFKLAQHTEVELVVRRCPAPNPPAVPRRSLAVASGETTSSINH